MLLIATAYIIVKNFQAARSLRAVHGTIVEFKVRGQHQSIRTHIYRSTSCLRANL
jgi:hypothetical protein